MARQTKQSEGCEDETLPLSSLSRNRVEIRQGCSSCVLPFSFPNNQDRGKGQYSVDQARNKQPWISQGSKTEPYASQINQITYLLTSIKS
mgnify:CR=1 FL=1